MTCPECEVRLADSAMDDFVEEHLRLCAACRAFRDDLRENALALGELRQEALPAGRDFETVSVVSAVFPVDVGRGGGAGARPRYPWDMAGDQAR